VTAAPARAIGARRRSDRTEARTVWSLTSGRLRPSPFAVVAVKLLVFTGVRLGEVRLPDSRPAPKPCICRRLRSPNCRSSRAIPT
jgi:hypothetical protein